MSLVLGGYAVAYILPLSTNDCYQKYGNYKINIMKIETQWYKSDMPITGFNKETGVWGMYCEQRRHYWFGIKGLFGFRYSKIWGYDY